MVLFIAYKLGNTTGKVMVIFREYTGIITILNTELVARFLATAFVTHLREHSTGFAELRVRFPAEGLRAFFAASPSWVLKCKILTLENFLHHKKIRLVIKPLPLCSYTVGSFLFLGVPRSSYTSLSNVRCFFNQLVGLCTDSRT